MELIKTEMDLREAIAHSIVEYNMVSNKRYSLTVEQPMDVFIIVAKCAGNEEEKLFYQDIVRDIAIDYPDWLNKESSLYVEEILQYTKEQ